MEENTEIQSAAIGETSSHYAGWRVVFACFVIAVFSWGLGFYGQGVYLAELQHRQGWSPSLLSGASTAYYLFSAVLVIFVGDAIACIGPRLLVLTGIACLGVSTTLVGWVQEPWHLFADYGLMAVGWAALSVAAITTILGLWFDEQRGLAISLALNGSSAGGIVVTPVLLSLIQHIGFRSALLCAVLIMLIVVVPIALVWLKRPSIDVHAASASGAPGIARNERSTWTRQRALRDVGFWTVSASFALALFAQVGFLVHQIAFLEPTIGRYDAGIAVAITAVMAIVGRIVLGVIIDQLNQRLVSAVSFVSQAAALVDDARIRRRHSLDGVCCFWFLGRKCHHASHSYHSS